MRPMSRFTCVGGGHLQQQIAHAGPVQSATMSGRTSCTTADSFTYCTDLPTNTTDVPTADIEQETEDNVDNVKQGPPNILVAVRVRPLHPKELQNGSKNVVKIPNNKVVLLLDPGLCNHGDVLRLKRSREKRFTFDYVFDASKDQQSIYANTTEFLVDSVLEGFNATAFAYGATGAGKTYTMIGSYERPGVMVRTLEDLFARVEQQSADKKYTIRCSFLEIYNEVVRDLLDTRNEHCEVREDPSRGMAISNICEVDVKTADEILELLQRGNEKRIQEPTDANQTSSRSHAVLQVTVTQKSLSSDATTEVAVGKLSMVDLAGSERASHNNNRGIRMVEGNVINALCDKSKSAKNTFIPYRDSKLTRLLKDSLGGSCRTVMIANISPAHIQYEDTNNTLKYASRARSIKNCSKQNVLSVNCHLEKYTHVLEQLQAEVGTLRAMLASEPQEAGVTATGTKTTGMVKTLQERQQLRRAIARLDEQLQQLDHRPLTSSDWALSSVSHQARSLQKAKEHVDTLGKADAAENEELQTRTLLTPESPALLFTLLKNMKALLQQNYQLQQTNEQLSETLMKSGQSQKSVINKCLQHLPHPLNPTVGTFHSHTDGVVRNSSEHASYYSDPRCEEPTQNGEQQRLSLRFAERVPAGHVVTLKDQRGPSSPAVASSLATRGSPGHASSAPYDGPQHCSTVEGEHEHFSILGIVPPDSGHSADRSASSISQCGDFTWITNRTRGTHVGDCNQIAACDGRYISPTVTFRKGHSPTTSSMHVSHTCSPARWSSGSSPLQDCSFYTPRSQPLPLAGGAAPCALSCCSAVPNETSWSAETSAAVRSAGSSSPKCGTPDLSPCHPGSYRRHSRTPTADARMHILGKGAVDFLWDAQAHRPLGNIYVESSNSQGQTISGLQLKRQAAPAQNSQGFPTRHRGVFPQRHCASPPVSHYYPGKTLSLEGDHAAKTSEYHISLRKSSSRNFFEEADVPDELVMDSTDQTVHAVMPLLAPTVFAAGPACTASPISEKCIYNVNKGAWLPGTMTVTAGGSTVTCPPANFDSISTSCSSSKGRTTAPATGVPAYQHTDGKSVDRSNNSLPPEEAQTILNDISDGIHVNASEFGTETRAHFGFRRADTSNAHGA